MKTRTPDTTTSEPKLTAQRPQVPQNNITVTQEHLDNCAKEPIQFSNRIQSRGALIVFGLESGLIKACSENCAALTGSSPSTLLGINVNTLSISEHLANGFLPRLRQTPAGTTVSLNTNVDANTNATRDDIADDIAADMIDGMVDEMTPLLDVTAHHHQGYGFLEYLPSPGLSYRQYREKIRESQLAIATLLSADSFQTACQIAVDSIATITGYDRVQLYKFLPDYSGRVTHEKCAEHMPPFKGLYFPASDIPPQARELYRLNPTRAIFDTQDSGAPLIHAEETTGPLDLSYATLRSVSPVHLQYLRNMQVGASMSISCLVENSKLWGLICGHHATPKTLSQDDRHICKSIADALVLKRSNSLQGDLAAALKLVRKIENNFAKNVKKENTLDEAFEVCQQDLMALYQAQGVVLSYRDQLYSAGLTPPLPFLKTLLSWLDAEHKDWYASDKLWVDFPSAATHKNTACGILTQNVDRGANCRLIWFRPSAPAAIRWAGNPYEKTLQHVADRLILSPRRSFTQWCNENERASLPWPEGSRDIAKEIFQALFTVIESRADTLARLNRALVRSNEDLEQYAYAASHDLKAPLRAIDNLSIWLWEDLADKLSDTHRQHLIEMRARVDRMETLLDDFLDYAKVQPTIPTQSRDHYCTGAILIEDIKLLTGYDAPYTLTLNPQLSTTEIPRHPLQRVLLNLISNALKHNDKKHPEVNLTCVDHTEYWLFHIDDNGPGIEKRYHEKIFEPYEKLESRDTVEGSGLGLAIAKKVTDAEGGTLRVASSSPEHGTCFELKWPKHTHSE